MFQAVMSLNKIDIFQQDHFPYHVSEMIGLRWLRLNQAGLDSVPYELSKLQKLVGLR